MYDKKMNSRITVLSFLMTCAVVLYHTMVEWEPVNGLDAALAQYISVTAGEGLSLAMNYFFMVTGMLLFRGLTFQNYGKKIKRRIASLLIPFLIWQVLTALYQIWAGKDWTVSRFLTGVFLCNDLPDGPLWYMYIVFILACLSPIQILAFRGKKAAAAATILMGILMPAAAVRIPLIKSILSFGVIDAVFSYFPVYSFGCFLGYCWGNEDMKEMLRYYFYFLFAAFFAEGFFPGTLQKVFIMGLPFLLLSYFPVTSWMENLKIYKITFLVYAIHGPLTSLIQGKGTQYATRIFTSAAAISLSVRLFCLLFYICAAAGMALILHFCAPKVLRLLTGGRG